MSQLDEIQSHRDTLYEAIRQRLKVNLEYDSFNSGKRTRNRVSPYAVMFRKHAWYVIGHSERRNRPLILCINRIALVDAEIRFSISQILSLFFSRHSRPRR